MFDRLVAALKSSPSHLTRTLLWRISLLVVAGGVAPLMAQSLQPTGSPAASPGALPSLSPPPRVTTNAAGPLLPGLGSRSSQSQPAFPLMGPQPASERPFPARAPLARMGPGARDDTRVKQAAPGIEVWRGNAAAPQILPRNRESDSRVFIADTQPVTVVLHFNPLLAGYRLAITTSPEIEVEPAGILKIDQTGQSTFRVALSSDASKGSMTVFIAGVSTTLRFARRSPASVSRIEQADNGGAL